VLKENLKAEKKAAKIKNDWQATLK
jgi:hypothetical protein